MKLRTRTNQPVEGDEIENLNVSGELKAFENIVDKDGHQRFIDGNIDIKEITGISKVYAKWSLNGTHLMIVLSCQIENGISLTNGLTLADINLPDWIDDKIVPVFSSNVDNKTATLRDNNWASQNTAMLLQKGSYGLQIVNGSDLTLTSTKRFRTQFDLLIDNE